MVLFGVLVLLVVKKEKYRSRLLPLIGGFTPLVILNIAGLVGAIIEPTVGNFWGLAMLPLIGGFLLSVGLIPAVFLAFVSNRLTDLRLRYAVGLIGSVLIPSSILLIVKIMI